MLAVCGGGGSDAIALLVVLAIGLAYGFALLTAVFRAEDGEEALLLIVLLVASIAIGGLVFLYPHGTGGDTDYLGRFVISLVVSGLLGIGVVLRLGEQSAGRALFIALAGDILIPLGFFVLLLSSVILGTGCFE